MGGERNLKVPSAASRQRMNLPALSFARLVLKLVVIVITPGGAGCV
jgi:hypothetical protein